MTLRDELYEWLAELPPWQQDLARRLTEATHLEGQALEDASRVVLAAYGALPDDDDAPELTPITLEDLPGGTEGESIAQLLRIGHLRRVGVVAEDQELEFAENGLTIVYGPNAAGKSTYVGALKRVCRTVDAGAGVRSNVYEPAPGERPTATVEYSLNGERRAQQVDLSAPEDIGLEVVSVFDAKCAELYLNERNAVAFVPTSLVVLARLAVAQDAMRRMLDSEIDGLLATRPEFPGVQPDTAAARHLDALTAATNLDELRRFAELSEQEASRIVDLRAALATAASANASADAEAARQEARRVREEVEALRQFSRRLGEEEVARIRREAGEAEVADHAVAAATEEFAALGRPGIGGDAWQRMWQAAREFVEGGGGGFPPSMGETCPLCIQPLPDDAAERFAHFERHVRGSLQRQASEARRTRDTTLSAVDPTDVEQTQSVLDNREGPDALLAEALRTAREALVVRATRLRNDPKTDDLPALPEIPTADVERWAAARDQHAETLLAAIDPDGERRLRAELVELESREALGSHVDATVSWVSTLGRIDAIRRAHSALATNRITTKQRQLSQSAVTGALASALSEELTRLNCGHLPVDIEPRTAVGETQVALRLAGAQGVPRVSEVLSEGEQRAVSLAFFFAETGMAEHAGGVILDDPVSSLDDERRSYIARRLAQEATSRQVVVFTHDLPFMLDLLDQCERTGLEPKLQGVWRSGTAVGRIDPNPPFAAMKFRQRVGALTERVEQWDSQPEPRNADEAWHRVCDFYADMRTTWERAVEERLFRGVVQRFQREVMTLRLRTVEVTDELVGAVEDGMTRCSFFVHDAPPGTRTALPGRVELAADIEGLRTFERDTRGS